MSAGFKFSCNRILLGFACLVAQGGWIPAATLLWDGDISTAGVQNGSGNWETSSANRWYDESLTTYQAWNNSNFDTAKFGTSADAAAHSVTLQEAISVGGIEFGALPSGSYTISGDSTNRLTFGGADPTVTIHHTAANLSVGISGNQGLKINGSSNSNIVTFSGTVSNDYAGGTTILGGELRLSKTGGATAIAGDINIDGGILRWGGGNQVADTASITLNAGILWLSGNTDTIRNLILNGGDSNGGGGSNGGTLHVTDTLAVNSTSNQLVLNSATKWSVGKLVLNGIPAGSAMGSTGLSITGNSTVSKSILTVGSGGMELNSRSITLNSGSNDASGNPTLGVNGSQILLQGNVISTGNVSIQKSGNNVSTSELNLGNSTRTWEVISGEAKVGVSIVGVGGLTKTGAGTLFLGDVAGAGDPNTFTGMTTVEAGILKLKKTSGVNAIAGDVTVKTGAILDWDVSHQMNDTSSIYLEGGALDFGAASEVIANLYQSGGTVNNGGGSNSGYLEVTGVVQVTGGSSIILNSSSQWVVNRFEALSTMTGTVISLNANSPTVLNRFTVGAGGMSLTGQNINVPKGSAVDAKGSELVLLGNFTGTGANNISMGNVNGTGIAQLNLGGGQRVFDIQNGSTNISTPIVSTTIVPNGVGATDTVGGITKTGSGTLALSATNTYSGNTLVNGGTFRLASTGVLQNTPRITVAPSAFFDVSSVSGGYSLASGKTLEGGGQVTGDTTIASGAILAPGTSGGDLTQTLSFSAGLTLQNGSVTQFDLGNGGDYDKLSVTGSFVQQNGAKLLVAANGFTPIDGASFNLLSLAGSKSFSSNFGPLLRTGAEDNATDFDLPDISASGLRWDVSQLQSLGIISIVPEPSKVCLLLLGVTALLCRRIGKVV